MSFKKLYSYHFIKNSGEREVDQLLNAELPYLSGNWILLHQYLLSNHPSKKEGECDFILFFNLGIMIMEVKGSQVSFENNTFRQLNRRENKWETKENPFIQARENAGAVTEILIKNGYKDVFVGHMVVFPESNFPSRKDLTDPYWALDCEGSLGMAILESLQHQIENSKRNNFSRLNETKLELLAKLFSPKISDHYLKSQLKLTDSELKRKESENYRILEGLSDNRRIIIEGPPGSAKSLYAIEMAKERLKDTDSKLLYLSWNELLPSYINHKLKVIGMDAQASVYSYKAFLKELMRQAGLNDLELNNDILGKPKAIQELLKKTIQILNDANKKQIYDFIIVDEAQDLFDKGLDDVLIHFSGDGKKGIENGAYIIFHDLTDGYKSVGDREAFNFTLEYIKDNAAIYRLFEGSRPASNEGLKDFLEAINRYEFDFTKNYGSDLHIKIYEKVNEIIPTLKSTTKEILKSSHKRDVVVLFTSNLISGNTNRDRPLDEEMKANPEFEKITPENLCSEVDKVKFTTALTYKGLQSDTVILVVNDLYNKDRKFIYELIIGSARARIKLHIIIDRESTNGRQ